MKLATVEDILVRAREERLATVTGAELRETRVPVEEVRKDRYPPAVVAEVLRLTGLGMPQRQVGRYLGMPQRTVGRILRRHGGAS